MTKEEARRKKIISCRRKNMMDTLFIAVTIDMSPSQSSHGDAQVSAAAPNEAQFQGAQTT